MKTANDHFSEQFRNWEIRARGWQVFPGPITPEPPYVPFNRQSMAETPQVDDGRRSTFLSRLARKLTQKPKHSENPEKEPEPEPIPLDRGHVVELQASLPEKLDVSPTVFEQFLASLANCREPISFELLGNDDKIIALYSAAECDAPILRRQLESHFSEARFQPVSSALESAWESSVGEEVLAVEFGLEREVMLPLASAKLDPFVGIVGALSALKQQELGLFQVLWVPVQNLWNKDIISSVSHSDGKPFFIDAADLTAAAEKKVSRPLFAVVVRIFLRSHSADRVLEIARDLAASLTVFSHPSGNALIPLQNNDYELQGHVTDVLKRQTKRSGMILTSDELTGFVHVPSAAVRSPAFVRQTSKSKSAPEIVRGKNGLLIGTNEHSGESVDVYLREDQRIQHTHVIGVTTTGKSTLLLNLIRQCIDRNEGVAILDPHGDLADWILGIIPSNRIEDVVYVDPSDVDYPVGLNILFAHSELERTLLRSDLVAMFERLSTSWGDQMNSVLQNAVNAFLESDRGGTLADLRRFLIEKDFRNEFLKSVNDPEVVYYWQKSFPHLSGGKSVGPVLIRLDEFFAQKSIRYMVSQKENRLDFAHIMDTKKIFIARLPIGLLGEANTSLLGTLLVSKFQQIAMSRQDQPMETRKLFSIFIDEFSHFITPSMAQILSGARKYKIALTLAHHELEQLKRNSEVASAVLSHPYTRIVFKVGDDDARKLAGGFSFFEAIDLTNLEKGKAICRTEKNNFDFNISIPFPEPGDTAKRLARKQEVITASRRKYGTPRAEVEAMLAQARGSVVFPGESKESISNLPSEKPSKAISPRTELEKRPPPPLTSESVSAITDATESPLPQENPPSPFVDATPKPHHLGRGGPIHVPLQEILKEAAELLGFVSTIEKPVARGSADLFLERDGEIIVCEISITGSINRDLSIIKARLVAGIPQIAVVCVDEDRLKKLETTVNASFKSEMIAKVKFFTPDAFKEYLNNLPRKTDVPTVETVRGYKVTTSYGEKAKESAQIRSIALSMKRKQ